MWNDKKSVIFSFFRLEEVVEMIYPDYLKDDDIIGMTACSAGVGDKLEEYLGGVDNFKKQGFKIIETNNVRNKGIVSASRKERVEEFTSLVLEKDVKLIQIVAGGDFLYDIISMIDFNLIKDNVKWVCGSSDPTSLLFIITTMLDIATIYTPCNVSGFNQRKLDISLLNYFKIIKGYKVIQEKREKYELNCLKDSLEYNLDTSNEWIRQGNVNVTGRIIGGCLECLKDVIGTKHDYVKEFIQKYKDRGIIWYFDIFSMTSEGVYNTLLQFKNAGWFDYTRCILIGKVKYPSSFSGLSYEEAIGNALEGIPYIYKFDIGHVKPSMTIINGSLVRIKDNEMTMICQ